jgi:hypothetical protein
MVGALAIVGTFFVLRMASEVSSISIFALNLTTGLGLGLAIDYSLFVVSRYREEIARSGPGLEAMRRTMIEGRDADAVPAVRTVEAQCPYTGHAQTREWTAKDPVAWTEEAYDRLRLVPLIARPLARNTVERFARDHGLWRITTRVMDENKQAMIEADEFDMETMLVMFKELQSKQIKAAAEGVDGLSSEMRRFIDEAKAAGVTRCPIRDIESQLQKCPVDFRTATPEEARAAIEEFMGSRPTGAQAADEDTAG